MRDLFGPENTTMLFLNLMDVVLMLILRDSWKQQSNRALFPNRRQFTDLLHFHQDMENEFSEEVVADEERFDKRANSNVTFDSDISDSADGKVQIV